MAAAFCAPCAGRLAGALWQPRLQPFVAQARAHPAAAAFVRRRQVAFTGVRPSVRVFAEAPAAEQAAKAIKLEDVKEGSEYEGTVVRTIAKHFIFMGPGACAAFG